MQRSSVSRRLGVALGLGAVLAAAPVAAQDVAGLTFDVTVINGDTSAGVSQTGSGWVAGKRSRLDLRGPSNPTQAMPGMPGENISMLVHDSAGVLIIAMVDHDAKKVMYPAKMMDQVREMAASLPEELRMTLKVSNVTVDSLGAGETISGFATRRFRVKAEISVAVAMLGETAEQTMHVESEGDFTEELSEFIDPLQGSRVFQNFTSGMPFMDSSATTEMEKLMQAIPRGLALRQVDRMTGPSEGSEPVEVSLTQLSNIKRATFPLSVFTIPEGYTEMEMPMMPPMN